MIESKLKLKPKCNREQLFRPGWVLSVRCSSKPNRTTSANANCLAINCIARGDYLS